MASLSLLQRYGVYLLVLFAVALLVYILISLIQSFSMEQADRKIRENRSEGMANNIYFFIGRATLQQLQLSLGILLAGGLITTLIFCQVSESLIIVPVAALAFFLGMAAPWFYFSQKARRRAERFENSILDLSLGLTSGLRAGQALPQALEVFSRRCEGPLKEELMIVIREYRLGLELAEAMQRMYNRIPCEDLQLLIISIRLTTQSGGSMVEVLEKITRMIRGRTEFHQKLKALTAQGRFEALAMALAPLVAFLLLFFINNDLMLPMVQTLIGWCAIGAMLALEVIGYLVIRSIVDIKV
ncbi:type II secretion system F family protein [uncultured Victivallis sp.]|uniref:type II secretion system F family protein n=1 Tax=uncultured Victivallis sp. TaxID=354118 RepID=UPI0025DCF2A3|nr:type II secretion system F family protein [uncultured Victivallis sp.]